MNKTFNLIDLIRLILKWKVAIGIVTAIAAIGSIIISLALPNYYESSVIFFPSNPSLTDRQNLFRTEAGDMPVSFFGKEKDADRLLQIGKSAQLTGYMIHKFDLFKHYDIDPETAKYPQYQVNKEFEDNYTIFKNEFGAIEIHVIDQDKQMAANMANEIVRKIDEINSSMIVANKKDVLDIFEKKVAEKKREVEQTNEELISLKEKFNIHDAKTFNPKGKAEIAAVEEILVLEGVKESSIEELNTTMKLFSQYKTAAEKNFSSTYILQQAYPAEKKVKPIRWLIVVSSTLTAFIVSILLVAFIDLLKNVQLENKDA